MVTVPIDSITLRNNFFRLIRDAICFIAAWLNSIWHERWHQLVGTDCLGYIADSMTSASLLEEAKKILAEGKYFFKCSS